MVARPADRLSIRLVIAGVLMLLAFLPLVLSGNRHGVHPVSGYGTTAATPHKPSRSGNTH